MQFGYLEIIKFLAKPEATLQARHQKNWVI
jgi:hypothetical protein